MRPGVPSSSADASAWQRAARPRVRQLVRTVRRLLTLVARPCHRHASGGSDGDVMMRSSGRVPSQAAVIPVRRTQDGVVQVCLIRRKTSSKWSIPKGYIERGENHAQAALAEADEEAGLDGCIRGDLIGTYEYEKGVLRLT